MSCACIKKREFDISISHKGCENLILEDQSTWVNNHLEELPEEYDVTIKIASRNVETTLPIKIKGKTYITSKELFGSNNVTCLPDDIYCITTESCGYSLTINRAFLCSMETEVRELVSRYSSTMTERERVIINKLTFDIKSIKINAERGNVEIAKKLFKRVKEQLKNLNCDSC